MGNEIKGFIVRLSDTEHIIVPEDLDINKYDKEGYEGITIFLTSGNAYEFYIEGFASCCEEYGFKINDFMSSRSRDGYQGAVIWDDNAIIEELLPYIGKEIYHGIRLSEEEDEVTFTINLDGLDLILGLYNYHNGYYPHRLYVEYPGYTTTNNDLL